MWCPHGNLPFVFVISYAFICTCIRRHVKETIPSSSITWSEMEKQNIQAKMDEMLHAWRPCAAWLTDQGDSRGKASLVLACGQTSETSWPYCFHQVREMKGRERGNKYNEKTFLSSLSPSPIFVLNWWHLRIAIFFVDGPRHLSLQAFDLPTSFSLKSSLALLSSWKFHPLLLPRKILSNLFQIFLAFFQLLFSSFTTASPDLTRSSSSFLIYAMKIFYRFFVFLLRCLSSYDEFRYFSFNYYFSYCGLFQRAKIHLSPRNSPEKCVTMPDKIITINFTKNKPLWNAECSLLKNFLWGVSYWWFSVSRHLK